MRNLGVLGLAILVGCGRGESTSGRLEYSTFAGISPIGLEGTWIQVAPTSLQGVRLTLRADSSASGRMPRFDVDTGHTPASRWVVFFTSRESPGRGDTLTLHPDDGGDGGCWWRADAGCISRPVLCVGDSTHYTCTLFQLRGDSLALGTGDRYVRAHPVMTGTP